jgi:uncharacterized protein
MRRDDLNQPLHKRSLRQRLWEKRPSALLSAYVLAIGTMVGGSIWVAKQPYPFAGEPIVVMAVPQAEEIKTASVEPAPAEVPDVAAADPVAAVVTSQETFDAPTPSQPKFDAPAYQQQDAAVYIVPRSALGKAPIEAVSETSATGPLPRISTNGKKPADAYARTVSMGILHSESPKIVLILGGMGLNAKLTSKAAKELPQEVTFAFAPYGNDLQAQVNNARAQGHEILLQLPLEPVGFPASNPGPKTLLTDGSPVENQVSLFWHMSRFAGYVGVINYMGGRFLSADTAVKPLLTELRKRGLLFLEDGSLPLSASDDVAKALQYPIRRGQTVIDANADPESIKAALNLLEEEASRNGIAIGTGSGLDVTIKTVADWAQDAADRGILIIPASAAFKGRLG